MAAEQCQLLGSFGICVQGVLLLVSVTILVGKKLGEGHRRTWKEFFLDCSKQGVGQGMVHVLNMLCAALIATHSDTEADVCEWYWVNIMVDTTFGVLVEYLLLQGFSMLLETMTGHRGHFRSGVYGYDHRVNPSTYFKQLGVWLVCILGMKAMVVMLMISCQHTFAWTAHTILLLVAVNPKVELVFVMIITPAFMNTFQYWVTDSFIQKGGVPLHSMPLTFIRSAGSALRWWWLCCGVCRSTPDDHHSDDHHDHHDHHEEPPADQHLLDVEASREVMGRMVSIQSVGSYRSRPMRGTSAGSLAQHTEPLLASVPPSSWAPSVAGEEPSGRVKELQDHNLRLEQENAALREALQGIHRDHDEEKASIVEKHYQAEQTARLHAAALAEKDHVISELSARLRQAQSYTAQHNAAAEAVYTARASTEAVKVAAAKSTSRSACRTPTVRTTPSSQKTPQEGSRFDFSPVSQPSLLQGDLPTNGKAATANEL